MDETYHIYKATNQVNGKFYIGMTSHTIEKRWGEHVRHARYKSNNGHFYRAIRKHGKDNFKIEVLFTENSKKSAVESEILMILDLSPEYNSTLGGDGTHGHLITPEGRKKMREANIGNKYNLGRKWTIEQRLHMSQKKKGCLAPPLSEKMILSRANNMRKSAISRRIKVLCLNDSVIYNSVTEAANAYSLNKSSVSKICLGKRNSAFGLVFQYIGGGH